MLTLEEVIRLEELRVDAWITKNRMALSEMLHEDYLEINIFGRFSREQVLNEFFDQHELTEYRMSDHLFVELGESACGLSYRVEEEFVSGGMPASYTCYVIALYRKKGDAWKLAFWQITPVNG